VPDGDGVLDYSEYDTRLAAYGVIVDDDRVLLAMWNGTTPGTWTLPGGGVEFAETVEEGLVREIREETGYEGVVGEILGVRSHVIPASERYHRAGVPMKAVQVIFRASVVGGSLRNEVGGSTDEAAWVPLASVPSLRRGSFVDEALRLAGVLP
jgi:8-oxo-dGTP diphosphatase